MTDLLAFLFAAPFLLGAVAILAWFVRYLARGMTDPYSDPENWGKH